VITFVSPAQRLSRTFNHVGQNSMKITPLSGSVLREHQHRAFQFLPNRRVLSVMVAPETQIDRTTPPANRHFKQFFKGIGLHTPITTFCSRLGYNRLADNSDRMSATPFR
jgi:hypothetical protein